jgi:RHS repeat-associated protein
VRGLISRFARARSPDTHVSVARGPPVASAKGHLMARAVRRVLGYPFLVLAVVASSGLTSPSGAQVDTGLRGGGLPISYVYDDLGRLMAVTDPASDTAIYTYDAVGNITSITRQSSALISVLQFTPNTGPTGTEVTIYGTGFGATPGQNTVKFNGVTATVLSAEPTRLVATVPGGASTGFISVTSPAGTASSSRPFTVAPVPVPTITGFSPQIVAADDPVTVTGTNFQGTTTDNNLRINETYAQVLTASPVTLTTEAPLATSSGKVSVSTPYGTAISNQDLFVTPYGYAAEDVGFTARTTINGAPVTVSLSSLDEFGLVIFDGSAGQRIGVNITSDTLSRSIGLLTPRNVTTVHGDVLVKPFEGLTLPITGTYTLFVRPQTGSASGSVTLEIDGVQDVVGTITPNGPPVTVSFTKPGQQARLSFNGMAGRRLAVHVQTGVLGQVRILNPNGSQFARPFVAGVPAVVDAPTLVMSGPHTLMYIPNAIGNVTLRLHQFQDIAGTIAIDGPPVTVTTTTVGQNGSLTFSGTEGQRVALRVTDVNYPNWGYASIRNPDRTDLINPTVVRSGDDGFLEATLVQTGTHTVFVDPYLADVGSATLTLYKIPADVTGSITIDGPPLTVTIPTAGQNATISFSGNAGQDVSLEITDVNNPLGYVHVYILDPSQNIIGSTLVNEFDQDGHIDSVSLPVTGTYAIVVDPELDGTGSLTLQLHADVAGSITIGGPPVVATISSPGQEATYTFSGPAGQDLRLGVTNVTILQSYVSIEEPDGSYLVSPTFVDTNGKVIVTPVLPVSGTYTIVVDPSFSYTGNMTLELDLQPGQGSDSPVVSGASPATEKQATSPPPNFGPPKHLLRRLQSRFPSPPHIAVNVTYRSPFPETWVPGKRALEGYWRSDRTRSPWQDVPSLRAPIGVTALAGQVLKLNGEPLAGVMLEVDGVDARSDSTGRFLIKNAQPGQHELVIDGASASSTRGRYGFFEAGVYLQPGVTNVLPFTIWMPRLDTAHEVAIPEEIKKEIVVTTPLIPGLEVHIPAGAVLTDEDGNRVRRLGITPIPTDRTSFPLPKMGVDVPVFYTVQPGGAYVDVKPAWIVYPNAMRAAPGQRRDLWSYDPDEGAWWIYGQGTVTADGRQLVPDRDVRVYEFTGQMMGGNPTPPVFGPPCGHCPRGGDPVDLATGLFVMDKADLFLPDILSLDLTRTYRNEDPNIRPFGVGMNHPYVGQYLYGANQYQLADFVDPAGGRIHFVRNTYTNDNDFFNATYRSTSTPGSFYGSWMAYNDFGWDLTLRDGKTYVYGENAPLEFIHDRYGNEISLLYADSQSGGYMSGNILQVTSPNGRWIRFAYDPSNRITEARDNLGRSVSYEYDGSSRLFRVTDSRGGVTQYGYDANGRMRSIRNPRNVTYLTNTYDPQGRVTRQTLADGAIFRFAYVVDGEGRVTRNTMTDPRGNRHQYRFNNTGYMTQLTMALGTSEQQPFTYTRQAGTNLLTRVVDALTRRTDYAYDAMGNTTRITQLVGTPDAVTTTYTFNPRFSGVASIRDPLNHTTAFSYDTRGSLIAVTDPLSNRTEIQYQTTGLPISVKDPLENATSLSYQFGLLVELTDPLDRSMRLHYDSGGWLRQLTDRRGLKSSFEYDAAGRPITMTDALGGVVSMEYDANGNPETLIDARDNVTAYSYDLMDRLSARTDPLQRVEQLTYDLMGNLVDHVDRKGQVTTFNYDPLNRLSFVGFGTEPEPSYESTITYLRDKGNRLLSIADSSSGTVTRTYDGLDRMVAETTQLGTLTYEYDAAGRRTEVTVSGQPPVSYTYDAADRLTGLSRGPDSVSLAYDDANRRTNTLLPNGVSVDYEYDELSRPTSITYANGSLGALTYLYDTDGNPVGVGGTSARTDLPAPVDSATYDDADQLVMWGSTPLSYDENGNLVSDGLRSLAWNARNELTSINGGGLTASFTYDAFGRRLERTVNGSSRQYLYDGLNPVQELVGGTPTANLLTGLEVDEIFTRTDAAGKSSFLRDRLGSTLALTDSAGLIQTEYTYEPYGESTATGVPSSNSFQFTGRENDGTGLQFFRARYLSSSLHRFAAEDPYELQDGQTNVHTYAGNAPTKWTDPLGLRINIGRLFGWPRPRCPACGIKLPSHAPNCRLTPQPPPPENPNPLLNRHIPTSYEKPAGEPNPADGEDEKEAADQYTGPNWEDVAPILIWVGVFIAVGAAVAVAVAAAPVTVGVGLAFTLAAGLTLF